DAIVASAPGWLRGSLRRALGRAEAGRYLAAGPVPPPIGLAVVPAEDRDAVRAAIAAAVPGAEVSLGNVSPHAVLVRGAGDVRRLPGFGRAFIAQEEGAQLVALSLGVRAGERVLDACAGRGNKAWLLGAAAGPSGVVDAADLYPAKLDELRAALGGRVHATFAVDWSVGPGDVPGGYDRVLVDAPCSGTGTLRRRPEIARGKGPDDLARLSALQAAIARRAACRARVGGRVVYAVCSVLAEEAEAVVARLLEPGDDLALASSPFEGEPARALAGDATSLRLLPELHGTDGYYLASFVRTR
ncbi:MAG TPA: RsmB/NOP family class I SAM-dependent RNA methyltransferase, partial [Minicystis sp.]|nr:RsmB/NOP family class I SAM-dependent RNA methyltransferase [Minicystis sp.]